MKIHYCIATLGLIAALTACPQTPAADTTAPTLVLSAPASAATGVVTNASLSIRFSENMDKTSVVLTSTPTTNLGAPVWSDSSTVVYTPPGGWQLATGYSVTVTGKDLAGNALAPTAISFQTIAAADTTPPATPSNVKATAGDGAFALEWAANAEADLGGYTVYWGASAATLVNAKFIAKPTTTLAVSDLENAKPYFYAVDAEDSSGNRSPKSAAAAVTPADTTPPALTSSEPSNGALVFAAPSLSFTFNEPINPASLEIGLCVTTEPPASASCDTPALASFGAPTWSDADARVQFTPSAGSFASGKTYVLLVFGKDKTGNSLPANTRIAFATGATPDTTPPTVTDFVRSIDSVKGSGKLTFVFAEAMNQTSMQNAFLSQPPLTCFWTWTGNAATCAAGLQQDTLYTLTIGTGASDTAGNKLAIAFQTSINTRNFRPRVTEFTPNPGVSSGFFAVDIPIIVTFSEPLTLASFEVKVGTQAISGSVSLLDSPTGTNTVATFKPDPDTGGYGNGSTVTWTLIAIDKTGLQPAADVTNSFQTKPVSAP